MNEFAKFWLKLWKLIRPYKHSLGWTVFWILIVQILILVDPYLFKLILDEFSTWGPGSNKTILWLIGGVFVTTWVITAVNNVKHRYIFKSLLIVEREVPSRCMRKLLDLSFGYHLRENTGGKMGKITRGTHKLIDILAFIMFDVVPTLIEIVLVGIVILTLNWLVALIFLAAIPLYLVQVLFTERKIGPMRRLRHDRYETADHMMTQAIVNVSSVQSFAQEQNEYGRFYSLKEKIFKDEMAEWIWQINFDWFRAGVINVAQVAVLAVSVWQVSNGNISMGSLVLFLILSNKVYFSIYKLSRLYEKIADASESVTRLINILDEPVEIESNKNAIDPEMLEGNITFENISFCYPETNNGIHGLSLEIGSGQTVGLCGPSGGGKSTLARLVPRFYDVCSGSIQIDGVDVRELDLRYRRHIAAVPQEVEIFDGTIADNIKYGCPGATDAQLREAARVANVDEFVEKLEHGYKTVVGERGLRLSGGQRQRVGIARAILCDPAVLIFDEATSHLDPISEELIQKSMKELMGTRTILIIAHRLSTIQDADRIVVLDEGRIKEQGTHASLMARGGLYHELATCLATDTST